LIGFLFSKMLYFLMFSSFPTFALMMCQAAAESRSKSSDYSQSAHSSSHPPQNPPMATSSRASAASAPKYLAELLSMGFPDDLIRITLEAYESGGEGKDSGVPPLHELVTILSDMQEV
jgi:hypothetical protein